MHVTFNFHCPCPRKTGERFLSTAKCSDSKVSSDLIIKNLTVHVYMGY